MFFTKTGLCSVDHMTDTPDTIQPRAMSVQEPPKIEEGSETTSASTPLRLTSENLSNHERNIPAVNPSCVRMQRWLADSSDNHALNQADKDWDQLKQDDEVAAAIERAIGGGGN